MHKTSHTAPTVLVEMERERQQQEGESQPRPLAEGQAKIYAYRTEDEGLYFTKRKIEAYELEEAVIDAGEPETDQRPTTRRDPPYFLHFLLLLVIFLLLDSADSMFATLLTPIATITIVPSVKTVTLNSTAQLGKLLSPLTLSQSQTVPTTGHGHQDAARATGTLTVYNGLSTVQSIAAGTLFTGSDGVQVVTDATVTIAANNPPYDGEAQVFAHAVNAGRNGNIQAEDINITLSAGLYVKNLVPFNGGQDSRDYQIVTQADLGTAAAALKTKVTAGMTAALNGQVMPGESIQPTPCTPAVTANHHIGDEAETVTITVSETCTAVSYSTKELDDQAAHLLTTQEVKTVGKGYMLFGTVKVTVTQVTIHTQTVGLSFATQAIFVYQVNAILQQRIKALVAGKPRLSALHQLATLPGIQHASISGVSDNQPIPDDLTSIHLLLIIEG